MSSLRDKALKGFFWNSLDKFVVKGISFVIGIILSRVLDPSDYGLLGMLAVFLTLSQIFVESGFSKALIQKTDSTNIDYSTVFYFNLFISILIYLILYFSAPYISLFYSAPELTLILRVLSFNFVIGSFNIVQRAKLMAAINFKPLAKINFITTIFSGLLGIIMAYRGWGVWALVGQILLATFLTSVLLSFNTKWCPLWAFSLDSLKKLFSFGSKILIAGIVSTIFNNIYSIAIGRKYKSEELGYYTRANQIADVSAGTINDIIGSVTYPLLASIKDDKARLVILYSKLLSMTAFLVFPLMALISVLAYPFVLVFLTEKWLAAASLISWLCIARSVTPISSLNLNLLNVIGRSDLFLKIDLLKLPLAIITLIITIPLGVKAIVIGNLVTTFIAFFMNAYYPGKLFKVGPYKQLKLFWKTIISTIIMAILTIMVNNYIDNNILKLFIGSIVAIFIFLLCSFFFKNDMLKEMLNLIKKRV